MNPGETLDPEFLALVENVTRCTEGQGAEKIIESLHRAAWKFSLTYSTFDLPYLSGNPVGPAVKGKVEEVARFLINAFRSWCPPGALTRSQLERLDSSLLLLRPAFSTCGFEVQIAIKNELEDLEAFCEASVFFSRHHELVSMTLEQLNHHKNQLIRSGDQLFAASLQAAIDQRSTPSANGRLNMPSTVESVTSPATYAPL